MPREGDDPPFNSRADLAVLYASRGWAVFPLRVGGKQPLPRSSGFLAATTDLVQIRQWWRQTDYNIGIWTGASDLVVIDLDVDKDGAASWSRGGPTPGIAWWTNICQHHGCEPFETYCVTTARGGMHVYFAIELGVELMPSTGKLSDLVDVRAAGSYVVAAGCESDDGPYEVANEVEPLPAPDWVLALCARPDEQDIRKAQLKNVELAHDLDRWLDKARDDILRAHPGNRNDTFNWVSFRTFRYIPMHEHDAAHAVLESCGEAIGLSGKEIRDTLNSARRAAERFLV